MRILFFGTPEFAKNVLSAIAASEYKNDIIGVVTREDKPKDRGHKLMPTPVKVLAQELGYPVYQPSTLKEAKRHMRVWGFWRALCVTKSTISTVSFIRTKRKE